MDAAAGMTLGDIAALLQGGGNLALIVCVFFIRDASQRLARIEKSLDIALQVPPLRNRRNGTPEESQGDA